MPNLKLTCAGFIIAFSMVLCSCKLGRFVFYNFADIQDYKIFPSRPLLSGDTKFKFYSTSKGKYPRAVKVGNKPDSVSLDVLLETNKTVAFLIIKNDTIQYEKYFKGYTQESIIPSFSMANPLPRY